MGGDNGTMTNRIVKESDYFRINWQAWRFAGAVDLNSRNYFSFRFWRALILNMMITAMFPLTLLLPMFSFDTAAENLMNFNVSLTSLATSIKFLIFVGKLRKVKEIENHFIELYKRVNTVEQRSTHSRIVQQMRFVSKMFIWAYSITTINSNVSFVFREKRSLPFPSWFPFDWTESLANYLLALIYQIISITMLILQNFVDDLFPPLVFCIIAGHCELLIQRISGIGYNRSIGLRQNEQELIQCIRDQELLYSIIKLTIEVISWPMLVQFIVIAIDVGTAMCALFFYVETTQERLYYISFIFALALQIYPSCYYGTLVDALFARLHYAVFSSNWVDQSISYRKNAIIFAERTQRQPILLAGNFIPIALTTFVANCKAAYSLCTLIAETGKKD